MTNWNLAARGFFLHYFRIAGQPPATFSLRDLLRLKRLSLVSGVICR
jgi:hypothetical protein